MHVEWEGVLPGDKANLVRRVERSCFEITISDCIYAGIDRLFTNTKFVARYSAHCARIISNLGSASVGSSYLLNKLLDGSIDPYLVAMLGSVELSPDSSSKERNELSLRFQQKLEQKVSTKYTCRKCGGKATTKREYQGRAGDESSNFSIKCVNCSHVWRT